MAEDQHVNWLFGEARMTRDPYHYADALNAMQPGKCVNLTKRDIADISGSWTRSGWQVVMDNTIGSAQPTCWSFRKDIPTGDIVCCKLDDNAAFHREFPGNKKARRISPAGSVLCGCLQWLEFCASSATLSNEKPAAN